MTRNAKPQTCPSRKRIIALAIGIACAALAVLLAAWPDAEPSPLPMSATDRSRKAPSPFESHLKSASSAPIIDEKIQMQIADATLESCSKEWTKLASEAYEHGQREEAPMDVELAHELVAHATRLMRCSEPDAESSKAAWAIAGSAGTLWARSAHHPRALVAWDTRPVDPNCSGASCDMISRAREPTILEIQAEAERQDKKGYRRAPDLTLQAKIALGHSPQEMRWRERLGIPSTQ